MRAPDCRQSTPARSEPPSGKSRSSEQRERAEAHPALSGAAVWMVGSPTNPARSCREMAVLHGVAGGLGLDARSNVCGVCGGQGLWFNVETQIWLKSQLLRQENRC